MPFKRFLRNKKAQDTGTTEVPKAARSILLSGFMILVIIGIMMKSTDLFAAEEGQTSQETLKSFSAALSKVANSTGDKAEVIMASLDSGQVLAVFDTTFDDVLVDTCQWNDKVKKPKGCGNKICVAIYDEDGLGSDPYDYIVIEQEKGISEIYAEPNDGFWANLGKTYDKANEKAYPLLYGDCDGWAGEPLKLKNIAIEKKGNRIRISDDACNNPGKGQCSNKPCKEIGRSDSPYPCSPVLGQDMRCCKV